MERLAFRYDRHEEITRYIRMWHMYYHPMVMCVFCLLLKNSANPDAMKYKLIPSTFHKICILNSLP